MSLYRANDRLPEDETILMVSDPDEFRLFDERKALGFRGLLFEFKLSAQQKDELIAFISERTRALRLKNQDTRYIYSSPFNSDDMKAVLRRERVPENLHNDLMAARQAREYMGDRNTYPFEIRADWFWPNNFHTHLPSLTASFNGSGTVFKNLRDDEITLKEGQIFGFDETVLHKAPKPDLNHRITTNPRITFIC